MRKNIFTSPLTNLHVASPCTQEWNAMVGSDTVRFCGQCQLNVYNLSGMTKHQAEALIREREGRLCVRFYRRADGTVLTRDCPVGWRAIKQRVAKVAGAVFGLCTGFFGGMGAMVGFGEDPIGHTMGTISVQPPTSPESITGLLQPAPIEMGKPTVMGEVAGPERPGTTGRTRTGGRR